MLPRCLCVHAFLFILTSNLLLLCTLQEKPVQRMLDFDFLCGACHCSYQQQQQAVDLLVSCYSYKCSSTATTLLYFQQQRQKEAPTQMK